jgi:hypothetical protein
MKTLAVNQLKHTSVNVGWHWQDVFITTCLYRFIHSHNRAGLGYTVAVNQLADKTPAEISALRGYRPSKTPNSGLPFDKSQHTAAIPDNLDWRLYGTKSCLGRLRCNNLVLLRTVTAV